MQQPVRELLLTYFGDFDTARGVALCPVSRYTPRLGIHYDDVPKPGHMTVGRRTSAHRQLMSTDAQAIRHCSSFSPFLLRRARLFVIVSVRLVSIELRNRRAWLAAFWQLHIPASVEAHAVNEAAGDQAANVHLPIVILRHSQNQ